MCFFFFTATKNGLPLELEAGYDTIKLQKQIEIRRALQGEQQNHGLSVDTATPMKGSVTFDSVNIDNKRERECGEGP